MPIHAHREPVAFVSRTGTLRAFGVVGPGLRKVNRAEDRR